MNFRSKRRLIIVRDYVIGWTLAFIFLSIVVLAFPSPTIPNKAPTSTESPSFTEIDDKVFSQTALKYSISNTSNKGGKLGWVKETIMSSKIKKIIKEIKINNYTNPIVIPGGFLILKIEDIREVDSDFDLDSETNKIIKEKTNEQLNQLSNIYFNKIKKNIVINEL